MASIKKKFSLTALTESLSKLTSSDSSKYAEAISDGEDNVDEGVVYKRESKTKARYPMEVDLNDYDAALQLPSVDFVGVG